MFDYENFIDNLFFTASDNFEDKALSVFEYQYAENLLYRQYCDQLKRTPKNVQHLEEVPFLPISFFKTHEVKTGNWEAEKVFMSSGTTGMQRSRHCVRDLDFYHRIARHIFEDRYGQLSSWEIMALLPSYLEQGDSSLISMVDHFMKNAMPQSSYHLSDLDSLTQSIESNDHQKLLIGVSYALLDLAESHQLHTEKLVVMETGGMKGRRKEMIRNELHEQIRKGINVTEVHSEYGMTELTSQAYGSGGQFQFPKWAMAMIRDTNDPMSYVTGEKAGGINIIDLANISTCAFIATQDLGRKYPDGTFEVLGRFDNSDIRGCNLMI